MNKDLVMQNSFNYFKHSIEIFKKYDINWFAESGTALGCIRHRGFIPWDHDIDIGINVNQLNLFLSLQDEFKKYGLEIIGTDGHRRRNIEEPIVKKYIDDMQKPDFCKNLDFGRGKGNYYDNNKTQFGFFFKLRSFKRDSWEIDVFPYAKQYDTDKYFPTAYVSTGWKRNFFLRNIDNIIYCRFETLIIPICVSTFEYLIQLYGKYCLVDDGSGKNNI